MSILSSRAFRRISKILLITLGVLLVVLFGGVWLLNRWLKSPELHAQVERELSLALKMPLKFKTLSISVFGGLSAQGVTVPDRGHNFFEATSFNAKNDLLALARGKVVFNEIQVNSPRFFLVQRPNGEWKLPDLPPDLQAELDAKKKAKKAAKPKDDSETKTAEATPKPRKNSDVRVGRIKISNGSAELLSHDGKPFLTALSIGSLVSDVRDDNVAGFVSIGRFVWHGNIAATEMKANVSYSEKGIVVEKLTAQMGGGAVTGGFANKAEQPGPPFSLKLMLEGVDVSRAAMDADAPPPDLDGIVSGTLELRGIGNNKKSFTGKTTFTLRNGSSRGIDWINQLGEVVQQEDIDLEAFQIDEMKGEMQIGGDRVFIKSLTFNSPPLAMTATGQSRLDGTKLDLKANFLADKTFLTKRPNIETQFGPADANNMRSVPFLLTGSLEKPKQNLMEKLTGTTDRTEQKIKLGLDIINGIKAERDEREDFKPAAPGGRKEP